MTRLTTTADTWIQIAVIADLLRRREIDVAVDDHVSRDGVAVQITVEHLVTFGHDLAPVEYFAVMERLALALQTRAAEIPLDARTPPDPMIQLVRPCPTCRAPATQPCTPVHAGERETSDWVHPSRGAFLPRQRTPRQVEREADEYARQLLLAGVHGPVDDPRVLEVAHALLDARLEIERLRPSDETRVPRRFTVDAQLRAEETALVDTVTQRVATMYPVLAGEIRAELVVRARDQYLEAARRNGEPRGSFVALVEGVSGVLVRYLATRLGMSPSLAAQVDVSICACGHSAQARAQAHVSGAGQCLMSYCTCTAVGR